MQENVLISVLKDEDTALKVALKLEKILEDFRPTCGVVAELKIEKCSIIASYVQSEHWSGFLTGCSYTLISGIKPV